MYWRRITDGGAEDLARGDDVSVVVLQHLGLLTEDQAKRSTQIADVERLVIRVQQQDDAVHCPFLRAGTRRRSAS